MSERYDKLRKVHFEPSTIEDIDRSVLNYMEKLNLFVKTNEGFKKVPVLWGTSERSFLSKDKKEVRDQQGALKFPLISIKRTSVAKPMASPGAFQGNVPEHPDLQGGSLPVSRTIYQEKTMVFANEESYRLFKQRNYPAPTGKVVYRTISAPMPVNVQLMYEITLRTEYQQQMNDLMLPFITKPGTINYISLRSGEHRYEGFIQGEYQAQNNLSNFSSEERKFETNISLKVIGHIVGHGSNREKPSYSIRESAVEVKMPKERVITDASMIPEIEDAVRNQNGADPRFDPAGPLVDSLAPPAGRDRSGGMTLPPEALPPGDPNRRGLSLGPGPRAFVYRPTPGTIPWWDRVTRDIADTPGPPSTEPGWLPVSNTYIVESLKARNVEPADARDFSSEFEIKIDSEFVFVNDELRNRGANEDYTISGNTISFTFDITNADRVRIEYIKNT
tara:strand:+ start:3272 stop:4612 length:1341 start_codon:yes stop_codon:yes gene_type:complete